MKSFFPILFLLIIFTAISAAPLRNFSTEITQPDGSTFSCFASGDEYYHRIHDAQGYTIIKDPATGWFTYAEKSGSELVATSLIPGRDNPAGLGIAPNLQPDNAVLDRRFESMRSSARDEYGRSPTIGTVNNIVVFVRFSDQVEFTDNLSMYNDMFNSASMASVQGFFQEDSGNQLTVSSTFYPNAVGGVVVSYQDTNPRAYYQPYNAATNPIGYPAGPVSDPMMYGYIRLHTMLTNAVNFIAPLVPPTLNIDADNDGSIDNIGFICYGPPDGWSDVLWPHYWVLDNYYPTVPHTYINGKLADDYNFELQQGIDIAVISHEFSHTMGFPDLYHYSFDGLNPCGFWDLMDTCLGSPQHHLTYQKWKYGGWFTTVPTLPSSGPCSLDAVVTNPFDCYRYFMPTGEEIWMEYRRGVGNYESTLANNGYGSGLIIYRVDQSYYPWGNAGGPPDEIYVYRPYCIPSWPDGSVNMAGFAWELGFTAMNQFTDPNPFSQSTPGFIATFNIHSVDTNTGPTMNFQAGGATIPVIWYGLTDANWFTASNWTTGAVPTATDYVIIMGHPTGNPCNVTSGPFTAVCNNMRVESWLYINTGATFTSSSNVESIGRIVMDGIVFQVGGSLTIKEFYFSPWFQCTTNPSAQIIIGHSCLFDDNTTIQLNMGTLIFANIGLSPAVNTFTMDAFGAVMNNLVINKPFASMDYDSNKHFMIPTMFLGYIYVTANTTFYINSPQDIILDGYLTVDPTGVFQANMGKLIFAGNAPPQNITINDPTSYLNNVEIANGTGFNTNLMSNLTIKGDFDLNVGVFSANNNLIFIEGDWNNNAGFGAFLKGSSHVIFQGNTSQYIRVSGTPGPALEDFHILELANPADSLIMNLPSQQVQCDFYDWTVGTLAVLDGSFTAWGIQDVCIAGDIICSGSGILFMHDTMGNADFGANLEIHGGNVNFFSGNPFPASNSTWGMYNASLTMDSGVLTFGNTGIWVHPLGGTLATNISGGTINVNGDFDVQRSEFAPTGGLVSIGGSVPVSIATMNGGSFYDLQLWASNVNTIGDVNVNGHLTVDPTCIFGTTNNMIIYTATISGTWNIQAPAVVTSYSILVYGGLTLYGGAILESANDINISGGTLTCMGSSGNNAMIRGAGTSFWKMFMGGTLFATYTEFKNLREEGLWVNSAGLIDLTGPLDYCIFKDGATGCTMLTFANNQTMTITGIDFPYQTSETYNIAKTNSTGTITVNNATGSFAGPTYENDPYGLVNWSGMPPNLVITSFSASNPNPYVAELISYSVTIYNNSANPVTSSFNVHLFTNRATAPGWNDTSSDAQYTITSMTAYQSINVSFAGYHSMTPASWTSWLLIDPEGAVTETNELDNLASTTVTFSPIPAVSNIAVTYTGSNTARISWTYPIWADDFLVYDDTSPYGSFTNLVGTTTNLYYDVTTSGSQRFYKVTARRTTPR